MQKRKQMERAESEDSIESQDEEEVFTKEMVEAEGRTYVNKPQKKLHRMHAHINPFNPLSFDFPKDSNYVDWSVHYP
jgi:hypothetical protein